MQLKHPIHKLSKSQQLSGARIQKMHDLDVVSRHLSKNTRIDTCNTHYTKLFPWYALLNKCQQSLFRKKTFRIVGCSLIEDPLPPKKKTNTIVTSKCTAKSRIRSCGAETPEPIATKFCMHAVQDVITHVNFYGDQ